MVRKSPWFLAAVVMFMGCQTKPKPLTNPSLPWTTPPRAVTVTAAAVAPTSSTIVIALKSPPTVSTLLASSAPLKSIYRHHGTAVYRTQIALPDQRQIVLYVVLTNAEATHEARLALLREIRALRAAVPQGTLALVAGDLGITPEAEERESLFELWLSADWLISHIWAPREQLADAPFSTLFLFSKDLFDGTNGWKALPQSIRQVTGGLAVDLVPVD